MIDWKAFNSIPTEDTLQEYPTILDILKDVVAQEEDMALYDMPLDKERTSLHDMRRVGHYVMIFDHRMNMPLLNPTSRSIFTYYRGQNIFYERCLPSLYRYSGAELEKETFRSYFQTAEMILVMKSHSVINYLENNGLKSPVLGLLPLPIIYDGLAQHYGIKTCYLDLTNDIWTAVFFASTTYDGKEYHPKYIKEGDGLSERFGVIYRLNYHTDDTFANPSIEGIKPIGLQYFNRPGRQCGLVRNMSDVHDLHLLPRLERIFFRHENEASKLIFTLSQFSKRYMPEDSLVNIVESICASDVFCEQTISLVHNIYYPSLTIDVIKAKADKYSFKFTSNLKTCFDKDEVAEEYNQWKNGGAQRYADSLIIIPTSRLSLHE